MLMFMDAHMLNRWSRDEDKQAQGLAKKLKGLEDPRGMTLFRRLMLEGTVVDDPKSSNYQRG